MTSIFYKDQEKFYLSVDCIILGFKDSKLYLLVSKRKFEPGLGLDTLMGGFLRSNEGLSETVKRVVLEYTGIDDIYMEQVGTYGELNRDEGERVVSVAYYALVDLGLFDNKLNKTHDTRWEEITNIGNLIFDHNQMLNDTLDILRRKSSKQPIGFNLLPENSLYHNYNLYMKQYIKQK